MKDKKDFDTLEDTTAKTTSPARSCMFLWIFYKSEKEIGKYEDVKHFCGCSCGASVAVFMFHA